MTIIDLNAIRTRLIRAKDCDADKFHGGACPHVGEYEKVRCTKCQQAIPMFAMAFGLCRDCRPMMFISCL